MGIRWLYGPYIIRVTRLFPQRRTHPCKLQLSIWKQKCPVQRMNWTLAHRANLFLVCSLQENFLACIDVSLIGQGIVTAFAVTDANDFLDRIDKDDPVADVASLG